MENKKIIIKSLNNLKKEVDKRNQIIKSGVDLSNYENGYSITALKLLSHLMGGCEDYINYWLYEDGRCITIDNEDHSIETAEDLYNTIKIIKSNN